MNETSYPRPSLAVDLVILTVLGGNLKILLVERKDAPFAGSWALPGGFVRVDSEGRGGESLEAAARRELEEETGLHGEHIFLEQLYTFGDPHRDPRTRVVSVAWFALIRPTLAPYIRAGGDASGVRWTPVASLEPENLAFDHTKIVNMALERIRGKLNYSPIALELVPESFTVSELRHVHEAILQTPLDPPNFRRNFKRMLADNLLEETGEQRPTGGRKAKLYRFAHTTPRTTPLTPPRPVDPSPTHARWSIFVDATTVPKTEKICRQFFSRIGKTEKDKHIEPCHKGGHKITFVTTHTQKSHAENVLEIMDLANRVGKAWVLRGNILMDPSGWSTEGNLPGITAVGWSIG